MLFVSVEKMEKGGIIMKGKSEEKSSMSGRCRQTDLSVLQRSSVFGSRVSVMATVLSIKTSSQLFRTDV